MPYYTCTFINDNGRNIKKTLFSDSKQQLREHYLNADEKLVYVKRDFLKETSGIKIFSAKIAYFEFMLFNQKMITLLRSGVSFVRGLEIITENIKNGTLKEVLKKTDADIQNGMQISDAFSSEQIPFHKIYKASLLAGEKSGNSETILEQFNSYLEKIATLRRKVVSSLSYPIILILVMTAMVTMMLVFVIPKFADFYKDFDAELPIYTQLLVDLGTYLNRNFVNILLILFTIVGSIKGIEKFRKDIVIIDYYKSRLPLIGNIILENAMTVFARTMAILIGGGIPVPEAARIAVETFSNKYYFSQMKDLPEKIKEGNLLSDVLKEVKFIPPVLVEVIKVGETSGNLTNVLNENADSFEASIDAKISSMVSLIEPVMIVVIGLVVAAMLIAVYLPIFSTVHIVK